MQQVIRQKAEALLRAEYSIEEALADEDLPEILKELQTYQFDLELKNLELLQMQEELRLTRKKYFELYNFAPVAYFTLDQQGRIISLNRKGADWLKRKHNFLVGKPLMTYFDSKSRPLFFNHLDHVFQTKQTQSCELTLKARDGTLIPIKVDSIAAESEDGKWVCWMVMADISKRKRVEEQLRLFEAAVTASMDGIMIADTSQPEMPLIYVNPAFERITGFRSSEVLDQSAHLFLGTDKNSPESQTIQTALKKGVQCRIVLQNRRRNGQPFWNELTLYPLYEPEIGLTHFVGIQRDITEQKETSEMLRQIRERYTLAAQAGQTGVWEYIFSTRRVIVDDMVRKIFGYGKEDEISRDPYYWQKVIHPDDLELLFSHFQAYINGEADNFEAESRAYRQDGTVCWLKFTCVVVQGAEDKPLHAVGTITDITARKQAETVVAEKVKELARSNAELEQFAYIVSHDLQEPLRMVSSYLKLLERKYKEQLDAKADKYIHYAVDGATRMQGLISDLLQFSRIIRQEVEFEKVDGEIILNQVLKNLRMVVEESQAQISYDPLPELFVRSVQLEQLFQNLIGNALKFQNGDKRPQIDISVQDQGEMWQFGVHDNGIGFKPEQADKIFSVFKRLHRRGYKGSGIGLATCKKIVEQHGGRIWAEGQVNEGASFYFTLPK